MSTKQPKFIKFKGATYRLAAQPSEEEVKEAYEGVRKFLLSTLEKMKKVYGDTYKNYQDLIGKALASKRGQHFLDALQQAHDWFLEQQGEAQKEQYGLKTKTRQPTSVRDLPMARLVDAALGYEKGHAESGMELAAWAKTVNNIATKADEALTLYWKAKKEEEERAKK